MKSMSQSGVKSMMLMAQAMGMKEPPKNTATAFMGKSVSAELVKDENGYLKLMKIGVEHGRQQM